MLANMFLKDQIWLLLSGLHIVVMIISIDLLKEIFVINVSIALKSSLWHRCKHILRSLGLVSITRQMPRPRHKNKAIIRSSSHPSRQSLCFDLILVVVVVVIGLMETRLYDYRLSQEKVYTFRLCSHYTGSIFGSVRKSIRYNVNSA